ncbi:rCG57458, isoform CRA_b [Rattus norvegicus]|uniref:RCG57458, isoform CRA_b n=1 Tax=Rattus norvegicus TaxID=10116 RepID=A6JI42_RAT|nr:rCG57458, isoform CRA_b [Rattus norvegicus]
MDCTSNRPGQHLRLRKIFRINCQETWNWQASPQTGGRKSMTRVPAAQTKLGGIHSGLWMATCLPGSHVARSPSEQDCPPLPHAA